MSTKVPQWKLRRLAPRAVRVLARHKGKAPQLSQYEITLVPAVTKFVELYDASRTAQASATEGSQAQQAVEALRLVIRGWLGALTRDIPGFDIASYTDRQEVPDDVIGSGERLMEVCRNFKDSNGQPLPYQEAMAEALHAAIAKADTEWAEAQDRRVQEQAMREETRAAAVLLHKELVAFRRTLRAVLGSSHIDYQKLRAQTGVVATEEIDEVVEDTVDPLAKTQESTAFTAPAPSNGTRNNGIHQEVRVG